MTDPHENQGYITRLQSIDFMRGLVIVIMALDHVRDYVHASTINPLDLDSTTVPLYLTRWITHLCAPVFVLLAGVSAGLIARKKSKQQLARFLVTRGIWLVFIELTVVSFAWDMNWFSPNFQVGLQVIWALGMSMIALAALIWLPKPLILLIALALIFGHNAFDGTLPTNNWMPPNSPMPFWWSIHVSGNVEIFGLTIYMAYPLIPWVGVMALGYMIAPIFELDVSQRKRILMAFALSCIAAFAILRGFNIYGNPTQWSAQANSLLSLLAMLNVEKYPPSLAYLLATLGISSLIMYFAESSQSKFHHWMVNFGKVPFFFYVVHLYVIHLVAIVIGKFQGSDLSVITGPFWLYPDTHGVNLFFTYVIWLAIVILLYFPCRQFVLIKSTNKKWWLKYL
ncbi:DUF1624 domain-containing protein [Thalassotalea ganghwensis]